MKKSKQAPARGEVWRGERKMEVAVGGMDSLMHPSASGGQEHRVFPAHGNHEVFIIYLL